MPAEATVVKPKSVRRPPRTCAEARCNDDWQFLERVKNLDLPEGDGVPLEGDYHVMQIPLLDNVVRQHEVLQAYWGVWEGEYHGRVYEWLRLYDRNGNLVLTRAEKAEAELHRIRAILQERGIDIDDLRGESP